VSYAAGRTSGNRHRLGIIVYAAKEASQDSLGGGSRSSSTNSSTPLAVLQLTGSRSRRRLSWQRLLLPTTYVQEALDSGGGVVRLRLVCDGCESVGRRLVVEQPPAAGATPSVAAADRDDDLTTPYLEVVAKKSRGRRRRSHRRHRHRLCPTTADNTKSSRLATVMRRRC